MGIRTIRFLTLGGFAIPEQATIYAETKSEKGTSR